MKLFESGSKKIEYETWGEPGGRAIFFLHGFPGSHHQAAALAPFVRAQNLFLVACDRPGYGGTSVFATPHDFLRAARELLLSLGVESFEVLGVSGGAPWAHLMTSMFPQSVTGLGIVCGLCSRNRETAPLFSFVHARGLSLRRLLPSSVVEFVMNTLLRIANPSKRVDAFLKLADLADQKWLGETMHRRMLMTSLKHAFSQRSKGMLSDTDLYSQDWLRTLCDVSVLSSKKVTYFHGTRDAVLNHRMSEWMHTHVAGSRLLLYKGENHYSLPLDHGEEILREMAATR